MHDQTENPADLRPERDRHHTNVAVTVKHPAVLRFSGVHQSPYAEQGLVTVLRVGDAGLSCYEGYGCPPSAVSARLRELADEIDQAALPAADLDQAIEHVR